MAKSKAQTTYPSSAARSHISALGAIFGCRFVCRTCIKHPEWSRTTRLITARDLGSYKCARCLTTLHIKPPLEPIEE